MPFPWSGKGFFYVQNIFSALFSTQLLRFLCFFKKVKHHIFGYSFVIQHVSNKKRILAYGLL